jgi:hypothetical protein
MATEVTAYMHKKGAPESNQAAMRGNNGPWPAFTLKILESSVAGTESNDKLAVYGQLALPVSCPLYVTQPASAKRE